MSDMETSAKEGELIRFVDQLSMLVSSRVLSNELAMEVSHKLDRRLFLPAGGFGNWAIGGGGSVLGLANGSGLQGLKKTDGDCCKMGDCMRGSAAKSRALVYGIAIWEAEGARAPIVDGRYSGLRIGHEMPACSKMSVPISIIQKVEMISVEAMVHCSHLLGHVGTRSTPPRSLHQGQARQDYQSCGSAVPITAP